VVAQETIELDFTATMEMANAAAEEAEFVNFPRPGNRTCCEAARAVIPRG
jgi:hypothetical protein